MEQKPTVGRIVHYYEAPPFSELETFHLLAPHFLRAALIVRVREGSVRLRVFGADEFVEDAVHDAGFSETPKPGCWTWPPRV